MVYNGKPENRIKMDDLGVPLLLETPILLGEITRDLAILGVTVNPLTLSWGRKLSLPIELVLSDKPDRKLHGTGVSTHFFPAKCAESLNGAKCR